VPAADGERITKGPGAGTPRAGAIAGRWIASARRGCLGRMLITSERHRRLIVDEDAGPTTPAGRTGRGTRARLPGVRIHPLRAHASGFCAGTGPVA
jgi:hypothetical protein